MFLDVEPPEGEFGTLRLSDGPPAMDVAGVVALYRVVDTDSFHITTACCCPPWVQDSKHIFGTRPIYKRALPPK